MTGNYEAMSTVNKVSINAAILAAFAEKDNDDFIKRFREAAKSRGPQEVLDEMRNQLAKDIKNIGPTKKNGVVDEVDLNRQREALRAIIVAFEGESRTRLLNDTSHYQKLASKNIPRDEFPENTPMPELERRYKISSKMLPAPPKFPTTDVPSGQTVNPPFPFSLIFSNPRDR
jgi:hypothetical protein